MTRTRQILIPCLLAAASTLRAGGWEDHLAELDARLAQRPGIGVLVSFRREAGGLLTTRLLMRGGTFSAVAATPQGGRGALSGGFSTALLAGSASDVYETCTLPFEASALTLSIDRGDVTGIIGPLPLPAPGATGFHLWTSGQGPSAAALEAPMAELERGAKDAEPAVLVRLERVSETQAYLEVLPRNAHVFNLVAEGFLPKDPLGAANATHLSWLMTYPKGVNHFQGPLQLSKEATTVKLHLAYRGATKPGSIFQDLALPAVGTGPVYRRLVLRD